MNGSKNIRGVFEFAPSSVAARTVSFNVAYAVVSQFVHEHAPFRDMHRFDSFVSSALPSAVNVAYCHLRADCNATAMRNDLMCTLRLYYEGVLPRVACVMTSPKLLRDEDVRTRAQVLYAIRLMMTYHELVKRRSDCPRQDQVYMQRMEFDELDALMMYSGANIREKSTRDVYTTARYNATVMSDVDTHYDADGGFCGA
jgi:hypothetical protein